MINIILSGCNGAMGQVITRLAQADENLQIVCGFDVNTDVKNDYPVYDDLSDFNGTADVMIDFSHPSAFDGICAFALDKKLPLIMCTTGLASEKIEQLSQYAAQIPVFFSANMSIGINLLIDLCQKAARLLSGFDIEIIEKHHNQKIDAPSGTALAIADGISEVLPYEAEYTYDRHAVRRKRRDTEIGIHTVRGGTIVGEHNVIFAGLDETIEIGHSASSKEVFAAGALKAATFMKGKAPGMYTMKQLVEQL